MPNRVEESNPCCCSWQRGAACVVGAAAITAVVIGVLALSGMQYDFKLFKLEDLTKLTSGGMVIGGSATLIVLVGGAIYLRREPKPEKETTSKNTSRAAPPPPAPAPTLKKPLVTLQKMNNEAFLKLGPNDFTTLTEDQEKSIVFDNDNQFVVYKNGLGHIVFKSPEFGEGSVRLEKRGDLYFHIGHENGGMSLRNYFDLQIQNNRQTEFCQPNVANAAPAPKPPLVTIQSLEIEAFLKRLDTGDFVILNEEQAQSIPPVSEHQIVLYQNHSGQIFAKQKNELFQFNKKNDLYYGVLPGREKELGPSLRPAFTSFAQQNPQKIFCIPKVANAAPAPLPQQPLVRLQSMDRNAAMRLEIENLITLTEEQANEIVFDNQNQFVVYKNKQDQVMFRVPPIPFNRRGGHSEGTLWDQSLSSCFETQLTLCPQTEFCIPIIS